MTAWLVRCAQALMLTAEVAEAIRLVLTQKLLQNLKFGVCCAQQQPRPEPKPKPEPEP